jgi:hypothetical protein
MMVDNGTYVGVGDYAYTTGLAGHGKLHAGNTSTAASARGITASVGGGSAISGRNNGIGIGVGGYATGVSASDFGLYGSGGGYAVYGNTSGTYGGYFNGGSYGAYGSGGTYGVYGTSGTYGVYGTGYYGVYGSGTYGVYSSGSSYGGYFSGPGSSTYLAGSSYGVYVGGTPTYGVYAYGNSTAGRFYDSDGTATTFIAGASWGVEIQVGGAVKPGGGSWSVLSDRRTKKDISDFKDGLSVLRKLNAVNYTYNGLGGTPDGLEGIGFIAQEVQDVAPYMIQHEQKKLHPDDEEETDILLVDSSAMTFLNMNAIKELDLRIEGMEAKIGKKDQEQDAAIRAMETRIQELEERLETLER